MAIKFLILSFLFQISVIKCDDFRGSLAFIINDAASMADDIKQIKDGFNAIYNAVINSKYSPIENFVLVTFNSSDARSVIVTRDRRTFQQALNNIHTEGGVGPKYSMSGIKRALEDSLPRSYLYVFTDAAAKDSDKYEQVKRLAQKKSVQISFVLTGECLDCNEENADYSIYYDLAEATDGVVLPVGKSGFAGAMTYLEETVKYEFDSIFNETFPAGEHPISFTVGEHVPKVLISAVGCNVQLGEVFDAQNVLQKTNKTTNLPLMFVVYLEIESAGVFTTVLRCTCKSTLLIREASNTSLLHGFSHIKPKSFKDTSTVPKSGVKSYLTIKLKQPEVEKVKLTSVRLLDSNRNVILENPLEVYDEEEQLYISDLIDLPKNMFRVLVVGHAVNNNATILKMCRTPIEPIP